jgi:hypothetical protein
MSSHDSLQGALAPARVSSPDALAQPVPAIEGVIVTPESLGASLTTKETEHRLIQAAAQAEFERQETQKNNQHKRDLERRQALIDQGRQVVSIVVGLVVVLVSFAYTGPLIISPTASSDEKRFATALWTLVLGGVVGYLFGTRSRNA